MRCALGCWVVSVMLGLAAIGCSPAQLPPSSHPLTGKSAPEFQRPVANQDLKFDLKDARGRVVVVKFFAKYCEPCQRTLPEAQRLHEGDEDLVLVGVAEDERSWDVLEQVKTYGLTFPVIHDRGQVLSGRFRVGEMPATFVIDGAGRIVWVGGAGQKPEDLKNAIDAARRGTP